MASGEDRTAVGQPGHSSACNEPQESGVQGTLNLREGGTPASLPWGGRPDPRELAARKPRERLQPGDGGARPSSATRGALPARCSARFNYRCLNL